MSIDELQTPRAAMSTRSGLAATSERRIVELDGLRGLMTIAVIVSHYFGELEHGLGITVGWLAVDMFFVLSGFLIGRLILDKQICQNFFQVFYARRICRIIPAYLLTVILFSIIIEAAPVIWFDTGTQFPLWSYLTFTQVLFMIASHAIGNHWLAPTWTLAFEEHFYLVAPIVIVLTPRRHLATLLFSAAIFSLSLRVAIYAFGLTDDFAALVLLPARSDLIVFGVLAALAFEQRILPDPRWNALVSLLPPTALLLTALLYLTSQPLFQTLSPLILAAGCSAYIVGIVTGQRGSQRFRSRTLRFFGDNGYCLYLTHLPILGLMHGLLLGAPPPISRHPRSGSLPLPAYRFVLVLVGE